MVTSSVLPGMQPGSPRRNVIVSLLYFLFALGVAAVLNYLQWVGGL